MSKQASLLAYAQLLDSAFPIGGFSHSFGLETYVQQEHVVTINDLERYIISQIHSSIVRMEGLAIKGVYEALQAKDIQGVVLLDCRLHIQRTPRECRDGQLKMGKRLLKLGKSLYPEASLSELEEALIRHNGYGTFPIVYAWITHQLDIDLDTAVQGYLYSSVTTMVNSALRLMAIGQTDGQLLIRRMQQIIEHEWNTVRDSSTESMHSFSIAHDIRAMQHETLYTRLFMS